MTTPHTPDGDEPVRIEVGPELDLHTFRPSEIGDLIPEWLDECRRRGILRVRIIHGKGTGTLREGVHRLLARVPGVKDVVWPCDAGAGSWGATMVHLEAPPQCPASGMPPESI